MRYLIILLTALAIGCGGAKESLRHAKNRPSKVKAPDSANAKYSEGEGDMLAALGPQSDKPVLLANSKSMQKSLVERKIIYTAHLKLIVEDFSKLKEDVRQLIKKFDGMIANSNITGSAGSRLTGTWEIKIPVKHFDEFLAGARVLGVLQSESTNSREVTAEYYDLQARIKNKIVSKERLIKMLENEKLAGRLKDVLEIERQLTTVQGEIESMQGRLKLLENLTSLTTIHLYAEQIKNFVSPVPPEIPAYSNVVAQTFSNSFGVLVSTGKAIFLFFVAITPWLPVIIFVCVLLWILWRKSLAVAPGKPDDSVKPIE